MISAVSTYVPIAKSVKPAIEIGLNFLSDQCSKRAQKWSCIAKNQEADRGRSNAYRSRILCVIHGVCGLCLVFNSKNLLSLILRVNVLNIFPHSF